MALADIVAAEQKERDIRDFIGSIENISGEFADLLSDTLIEIEPPQTKSSGFILANKGGGVSVKPGNIRFRLKEAIAAVIEMGLTTPFPASASEAAKIVLLVIYKIAGLAIQKLNKNEAFVLTVLHKNNAYKVRIDEKQLVRDILQKCADDSLPVPMEAEIFQADNELLKLKCIDIEDGQISLKETVVYQFEA